MSNRPLAQMLDEIDKALETSSDSRRVFQALHDEPGYPRYLELNPGMAEAVELVFEMLNSMDENKRQIRDALDKVWPDGNSFEMYEVGVKKGSRQALNILNNLRRQRQAERHQLPKSLE